MDTKVNMQSLKPETKKTTTKKSLKSYPPPPKKKNQKKTKKTNQKKKIKNKGNSSKHLNMYRVILSNNGKTQ